MRTRKRWHSLLIVGLFFIAIFLPLLGALWGEDRGLSSTEKRKLQQVPDIPKNMDEMPRYISEFEEYYNDQFGLRAFFLTSYAAAKRLLGDSEISSPSRNVGTRNIIRGTNGWHFLNRVWDGDPISDYRNLDLYSEGKLWRALLLLAARADWLKERGIEYLLFFAPNKHTIYSEYLPDYIKKEGDTSSLDQLNNGLQRYTSVNFIDLRPVLLQSKGEAAQYWKDQKTEAALYYKLDSHWNGAGADIAQFAIAKKIAEMFPGQIHPAKRPLADFTMHRFTGDITLIMGRRNKEAYGPALMGGICGLKSRKDFIKRNHETSCPQGSLNVLIFYDSFLPPLKPYFVDYFKRTVFRWQRMTRAEIQQQMKQKKPELVIEQLAERHLPYTPAAAGENYSVFWGKQWHKWKKTVFTLDLQAAATGKYTVNNITLAASKKGLRIKALNNDPMLFPSKITFRKDTPHMVKISMHSSHVTRLQLFYSVQGKKQPFPSEQYSVSVPLKKGENIVYLPLFHLNLAGEIRLDPAAAEGVFELKEFTIKEATQIPLL